MKLKIFAATELTFDQARALWNTHTIHAYSIVDDLEWTLNAEGEEVSDLALMAEHLNVLYVHND